MGNDNYRASVFEKTFSFYLEKLDSINLELLKESLGVLFDKNVIRIPLLNKRYTVSKKGIANQAGERPPFDLCIILLAAKSEKPSSCYKQS